MVERPRVISTKYLPTSRIGILQLLMIQVIMDHWDIAPTWRGVLWTLVGIFTILSWVLYFVEKRVHPKDLFDK